MLTTTLRRIFWHLDVGAQWEALLRHLGKTQADDEPLPYSVILKVCGIDMALRCCRAEARYENEWVRFAVWCAEQVRDKMEDPRSIAALDLAARSLSETVPMDDRSVVADGAWRAEMQAGNHIAQDAARAASLLLNSHGARAAYTNANIAWGLSGERGRDQQFAKFLEIVSDHETQQNVELVAHRNRDGQ